MGCIASCKPASRSVAIDLVASYAMERQLSVAASGNVFAQAGLMIAKLTPILEFIKSGA